MKEKGATSGLPVSGSGMERRTAPINWAEVHRRLDAAQAAIEQGWVPTPEEKKKILRARAQALARELQRSEEAEGYLEVVEFLLAQERYGIESCHVREVYPLRELTRLPCTPPFVLGIISLRGQILPVIDIKKFFDLPEKGLTDLNKVIVVRTDEIVLGILADLIVGLRSISLADLQPSLPTLTGIRAEYLRGVTRDRLAVLDVRKILSDQNIFVHEEVEA